MCVCHSLFARGGKKAHHLHPQLKPLKVVLQVLSFNCETVLQDRKTGCRQVYNSRDDTIAWRPKVLMISSYEFEKHLWLLTYEVFVYWVSNNDAWNRIWFYWNRKQQWPEAAKWVTPPKINYHTDARVKQTGSIWLSVWSTADCRRSAPVVDSLAWMSF